ncbi:MAG: aldehyde dehydrogenase family protein [Chlamydiae bacterium]|nr:aldehyde dehydrogenase family protein [Chlamydiota bacterium]MBI3276508.1 aldehyde dehydrogenase family protein [Chlamydiota bacterium]
MSDQNFYNFIDGQWMGAQSGKTFKNINPANRDEVVGIFPLSDSVDVDQSVQSAACALEEWRKVPPPKKGEILFRAGEILERRKEELAQLMTREMGKVLRETRGDVQEAIDMAFYMAGEGRRLFGQTVPSELSNKFCMTLRDPMGVCGLITPWNFPMAIPSWKIFPALICGNTVILKPASDTPASATRLVEILLEAGLPSSVIQLVHGRGISVGNALVQHPAIDLVSFTGSSEVGREIGVLCAQNHKKVCLEMGGKNAQLVLEDANMDLALEGVLWGAFGTSGQRCTATSRLILQKSIAGEFLEQLLIKVKKIKIGNGLDLDSQMGPLINDHQLEKVFQYIKIAEDEGAELCAGGKPYLEGACSKGYFFTPTIFTQVKPKMRIAQEEVFGPVLAVIEASGFEEAIEIANGTSYGLSVSLYTQNVHRAFHAIRDFKSGIVYINAPTIGAEVQLPFGGIRHSGNGHREAGTSALDIFSQWKTVFVDYSGKFQRAQID